jgi:hypothetical protein
MLCSDVTAFICNLPVVVASISACALCIVRSACNLDNRVVYTNVTCYRLASTSIH